MISDTDAKALVAVLSLAENHQMWTDRRSQSPLFEDFVKEQYAAIQTVREFLKAQGILTLHELTQRLARDAERREEAARERGSEGPCAT